MTQKRLAKSALPQIGSPRKPGKNRATPTQSDILDIIGALLGAPQDATERAINSTLARIGLACAADRAHVYRLEPHNRLRRTHHWARPGTPPFRESLAVRREEALQAWLGMFLSGEAVVVPSASGLPKDRADRDTLLAQQVKSLIAVPMVDDGALIGFISLSWVAAEVPLLPSDVALLQSLTGVILSVLRRRETERQAAEAARALREDRALLESILQTSTSAILAFDAEGRVVFINGEAEAILGMPQERAVGQTYEDIGWTVLSIEGQPLRGRDMPVGRVLRTGKEVRDQRHVVVCPDGRRRILSVNAAPVATPGTRISVVSTVDDVTGQVSADTALRSALAEAHQLAFFDPLTGHYNRRGIVEVLRDCVQHCARENAHLALLYIDVDGMRTLNGSHGHYQGDALLLAVASRLSELRPEGGDLGRMSSDEFVLTFGLARPDADSATQMAMEKAEQILEALRRPFNLDGVRVEVTVSIGLSTISASHSIEGLMKGVDLAVMSAKAAGGDRICAYRPDMEQHLSERLALAQDLRDALRNDDFRLHFEPKVRWTGTALDIVGHEALIRWQHPQRGLLGAVDFVPFAEETGFIREIDVWVLQEACRQLRRWADDPERRSLHMSVNISSAQFLSGQFADLVQATLTETGADPLLLELEVTEGTLLSNLGAARATMLRLRAMGITLALDDFGTGFSSLSYLRDLPVDVIKIDRSFVVDLMDQHSNKTILEGIIGLARGLGVRIVAEGVETESQLIWLAGKNCRVFQGYLFGRPQPVAITRLPDALSGLALPAAAAAEE